MIHPKDTPYPVIYVGVVLPDGRVIVPTRGVHDPLWGPFEIKSKSEYEKDRRKETHCKLC